MPDRTFSQGDIYATVSYYENQGAYLFCVELRGHCDRHIGRHHSDDAWTTWQNDGKR